MRRTLFVLAASSLCALSACTGPMTPEQEARAEAEAVEESQQAIVGGAPDTSDRSVGLVVVHYIGDFQDTCSGVVIGQSAVLTSAHCFLGGTIKSVEVGFANSYGLPASGL